MSKEIIENVADALKKFDGVCSISINDDRITEVTRESDPDEKWDRDDTHTDHNFTGFSLTGLYPDLEIGYLPRPNRTYYLVVVVYSTGNSFGHDSGDQVEYIDLYKTEKEALVAQKVIEDDKKAKTSDCHIKTSTGLTHQLYTGAWKGYFESLDYVEVVPMEMIDDK